MLKHISLMMAISFSAALPLAAMNVHIDYNVEVNAAGDFVYAPSDYSSNDDSTNVDIDVGSDGPEE